MSRDIKFRAWIKIDEGLMISQSSKSDFMMVSNGDGFGIVYDYEDWLKDEQFEIMQYTGKKDKNGVEIYEGDIVEYNTKRYGRLIKHKSEIIFKDGCYMFKNNKTSIYDFATYSLFGICKVIGNIYENPELLAVQ